MITSRGAKVLSSDVIKVLKEKKITDYLSKKGHESIKQNGGRLFYLCPFPDHVETKPSFTVWTNGEFENFYCFGCNRHHNIINLVSEFENISYKEAFKRLSDGIEINSEEDIKIEIANIEKIAKVDPFSSLVQSLMDISSLCRCYIEGCDFLEEEISIVNKVYSEVDKNIIDLNFEKIDEIAIALPAILFKRKEKLMKNTV